MHEQILEQNACVHVFQSVVCLLFRFMHKRKRARERKEEKGRNIIRNKDNKTYLGGKPVFLLVEAGVLSSAVEAFPCSLLVLSARCALNGG